MITVFMWRLMLAATLPLLACAQPDRSERPDRPRPESAHDPAIHQGSDRAFLLQMTAAHGMMLVLLDSLSGHVPEHDSVALRRLHDGLAEEMVEISFALAVDDTLDPTAAPGLIAGLPADSLHGRLLASLHTELRLIDRALPTLARAGVRDLAIRMRERGRRSLVELDTGYPARPLRVPGATRAGAMNSRDGGSRETP